MGLGILSYLSLKSFAIHILNVSIEQFILSSDVMVTKLNDEGCTKLDKYCVWVCYYSISQFPKYISYILKKK